MSAAPTERYWYTRTGMRPSTGKRAIATTILPMAIDKSTTNIFEAAASRWGTLATPPTYTC